LLPLAREWQSWRLGLVEARRRPSAEGGPLAQELDVWAAGGPSQAVGRLYLDSNGGGSSHVVLQLFGGVDDRSIWMWLAAKRSRRSRVLWEGHNGDVEDSWDCNLLNTVRKAADWVEERNLAAHLDLGLARLVVTPEAPATRMTVGLCVATMNRLWQLRRALPLNLLHCWPHRAWARIHVVDCGSTDGTLDFLLKHCRAAIDCGLLAVYQTDQMPFWHASIAKNTAHICASEDILVNLDSDNLIGPDFPVDVARQFAEGYTVLQYEDGEGTCGRIACRHEDFHKLRGYDEDCYPMGAQDVDLVLRLKALPGSQFRKVRGSAFSQAIHNSQELKVSCCDPVYGGLRWGQMDTLNRQVFKWRRDAGQLIRNLYQPQIGARAWRADLPACGTTG